VPDPTSSFANTGSGTPARPTTVPDRGHDDPETHHDYSRWARQ
jgi:hypothetical protein